MQLYHKSHKFYGNVLQIFDCCIVLLFRVAEKPVPAIPQKNVSPGRQPAFLFFQPGGLPHYHPAFHVTG